MKKNEVTVEEYIRNTLMKEIKEIGNTYPYLGFFLISSGIEFLGKCINPSSDWQQFGNSTDDFENAIDTFKSLNQYKRYTKRGDNGSKSAISLYSSLRYGLVHAMLPKDNLQLHKGSDESTTKINGVEKDFTLNQSSGETLEFTISASDLGVDTALHFKGVVTSTSEVSDPHNGDVCLVGNKEYIYSDNAWYELGDAESHALNTVTISGDDTYITGGGNLQANRTLSHKTYNDAKELGAYKVKIDSAGHVSESEALTIASDGTHKHTASVTIPGSSFGTSITPSNTKLSISKTGGATETVVTSYPGVFSKLNTTTITGVNGATNSTSSKATKGSAVAVATTDTVVSGVAKVGSSFNYGTADRASSPTPVMTGISTDKAAYHASYDETDECLELSAITITPTTTGIYEAIDAGTTRSAVSCADTKGVSITPAKSNGLIDTYTFTDVTVTIPTAAPSATTVATGVLSATGTGASLMTGLGTASTSTVVKTEKTYSISSGTTGDVAVMTGATLNKGTNTTATVTVDNAGSHNHDFN